MIVPSASESVDSIPVNSPELRREATLDAKPAYILQIAPGRRIGRVTWLGSDRWQAELRRCLHVLGIFSTDAEADAAILRAYRGQNGLSGVRPGGAVMTTTQTVPDVFSNAFMAQAIAEAAGAAPLPIGLLLSTAQVSRLGGAEIMLILYARYPELGRLLADARLDALAESPVTLALLTTTADQLAARLQERLHRQSVGEAVQNA